MTDNLNVNIHKVQLLQKSRNTDNAMLVFSGSRSLFNKNENIKNLCVFGKNIRRSGQWPGKTEF